jgi:hypothetical protein
MLRIDLSFLAPVPAGHDVLHASIASSDGSYAGAFVLDVTAGVLYADSACWHLFPSVEAVRDPLAAAARSGWSPKVLRTGRAMGAAISTKNQGDANHAETRLFIEQAGPAAPYR